MLTNTAVKGLEQSACSYAVSQALAAAGGGSPQGKYITSQQGYYMGGAGPIVKDGVNFFLRTLFQNDYASLKVPSLQDLGTDLCVKGIEHMTGDPGCAAARKSGGKTEHTSVNGGEFHYGENGAAPTFDNGGICLNCIFSMIMEAANNVDKDGSTSTPIDS